MAWRAHQTGLSPLLPIYYEDQSPAAFRCPDEYFFGSELIAAPITSPANPHTGRARKRVWLPAGTGTTSSPASRFPEVAGIRSAPHWKTSLSLRKLVRSFHLPGNPSGAESQIQTKWSSTFSQARIIVLSCMKTMERLLPIRKANMHSLLLRWSRAVTCSPSPSTPWRVPSTWCPSNALTTSTSAELMNGFQALTLASYDPGTA